MTISTNYNASVLTLQRSLSNATSALSTSLLRMSTGFKVNSAADDAAGLFVATKMNSQIRGLKQAQNNTLIGMNLLNTANSALDSMKDLLNRMRDLSVQASNDSYSDEQRSAMQKEIEALTEQYNQIKKGTNFNGFYLFEKPKTTVTTALLNASYRVNDTSGSPVYGNAPPLRSPSQAVPPISNVPSIDAGQQNPDLPPDFDEDYVLPEYDPGVQMTGEEMDMLKTYLDSGGSYDNFVDAFKQGRHSELVSESIKTLNQVQGDIGIMSRNSSALPRAIIDSGSVNFSASQTQVVTIQGVNYSIRNTVTTNSSLSWSKDSSGQITFNCSYFDITAQSDAAHDINIVGRSNTIRGGNQNDKITISAEITNVQNSIYAGGGDDEISILTTATTYSTIYLQKGNNTVNSKAQYQRIVGGTGDDNVSVSGSNDGTTSYAIDLSLGGNNTVNLFSNNHLVIGGVGNDTFNVSAGVATSTLIGNGGNNTLNNLGGKGIIATNITSSTGNAYTAAEAVVLNASETISDITLTDGKRYSIKNTQATNKVLLYTIDATGRTNFRSSSYCTIKALDDVGYKIGFESSVRYITFYGSSSADNINAGNYNTIYCGGGDDTVNAGTVATVYLESGNNNLTLSGVASTIVGGVGNDTFNINTSDRNIITGGSGSNTFNINVSKVHVTGGTGNDVFNIKAGISNISIIGGGGTDTATGNIAGLKYSSGLSNVSDSSTGVLFGANETKTVSINGIDYTLTNRKGEKNSINIHFNPVDGKVYFSGVQVSIRGESEKQHDVVLENGGYLYFHGGNLDDRIESNAVSNVIYGTAGNNTIISNSSQANINSGGGDNTIIAKVSSLNMTLGSGNNTVTINGTGSTPTITAGNGNNTWYLNTNNISLVDSGGNNIFHINGNNNNITGGTGNDTFIINGDNNITQGSAGNDYFQVNTGADNNVIGGTGTNYIVDSGTGTINNTGDVIKDPNSGVLNFNDNFSSQTITIAGKTYTVKNTSTERGDVLANSLLYNFNALTGEIVFNGNGFTITSNDDIQHKIVVRGDHNVVSGGNKNDNITVDTGTGNVIHGLTGDDTITMKSSNNKIYGDSGNDKIIISASNGNNIIDGGLGNDEITANTDGCTNIKGGDGNDRLTVNGNNNVMDGGLGDDYILAVGNDNIINSSSGKNTLNVKGSGNTINDTGNSANNVGIDGIGNNINLGNGNNTVNIIGQAGGAAGNTVNAGDGNNSFIAKGDKADITTGDGNNKFVVDGNNSQITSGGGTDDFKINGSNNTLNAGAGDDSLYMTGDANTANGGDGDDSFEIRPNSNNNNINGNSGENKMINYGKDTVFANVKDVTPDPIIVRLQVGANSDDNSAIFIQTDFIADDLDVDLMTRESAVDAIANIDKILNAINAQKANYGATLGRLDSVAQSQVVQLENLISATSTIMDADIAEESALFVKNQILQSTSSALLKQATQLQYSIISNLIR